MHSTLLSTDARCVIICVCVCVCVTLRYCIKAAQRRITRIMPHVTTGTNRQWYMAYLKAAIVMTLGVYFKVIYRLQFFSNGVIRSCKISIDRRVAQFLCNSRASFCGDIAIFWFSKMAAAAILDFWIRKFLLADGVWGDQTHHYAKIRQNWSYLCGYIAVFRTVKMAAAAISDFWNHEILLANGFRKLRRISMPTFVKIGQSVAKILRFFRFFKMAVIRHLGFVWRIFGPSTDSNWGSLSLCKIWCWSMQ